MRGGFTGAATPVDNREARTSAPGRGRRRTIRASGRFETVPVVRDPDVAGRVNGNVGDHLDAAALENVDHVAGLGAGGCPLVLSPASSAAERPHMLPTQTSSLPSTFKPHGMLSAGPVKPLRRGLGAIGTDHVDRTGDAAPVVP